MPKQNLLPIRLWVYRVLTHGLPETRGFAFKRGLLRWAGATIGKNVRINSSAVFAGNGKLTIGDDVWIGPGCYISPVGDAEITLGSHIDIASQVMILTGSHQVNLEGEHIGGRGIAASVVIGDGCWLCARSTILPGVTLGDKALVAAGAVVTKSFPEPRSFVVGVPATLKKVL